MTSRIKMDLIQGKKLQNALNNCSVYLPRWSKFSFMPTSKFVALELPEPYPFISRGIL